MATFTFGHYIDIHWNGYDIVGPANTVFSIPDQLYEEFESDLRDVEPTLTWIDTNEFQTLKDSVVTSTIIGSSFITTASTTAGTQISLKSGAATSGHVLTADGSGGQSYLAVSGGTLTSVIGVSPISTAVSGGTVSVSLNASYQTAGTYVTGVSGTAPITASGTTDITVGIDQTAITANSATNSEVLRTYVKNSSGAAMTKGQAVYVNGATGTNVTIQLATATSEVGSSKTLGLLAQDLANNAFGYVIESGFLGTIDTSAATAGSSVWLGDTPGSRVYNSPPAEPSHSVFLGIVARSNANNGEILVQVQNGYELNELHNVSAASPSDGDIIQYKTSSSLWTKASIANAGIAASVHTHDYQTAGTYVNSVIGTSPISASGTTAITLSIQSASTSAVGVAQLTDSANSTSTTTAATPNAVLQAIKNIQVMLYNSTTRVGNIPNQVVVGGNTYTSGVIYHTRHIPERNFTVSNLSFVTTTTASSGLTLARFGIYTRSGTTFTLVARTASDTTIGNATNTRFTRALDTTGGYPATYDFVAGNEYWVSVIQIGTTPATLLGSAATSTALNNAFGVFTYSDAGETDLVASSTGATGTLRLYAEVS